MTYALIFLAVLLVGFAYGFFIRKWHTLGSSNEGSIKWGLGIVFMGFGLGAALLIACMGMFS